MTTCLTSKSHHIVFWLRLFSGLPTSPSSFLSLPQSAPQPHFVAPPLTCIYPHIVHQLFSIKFSIKILSDFEKSPLRFFLLFSEPMHFTGLETFWNYQSKNYFCSFCIILCSFYTTQPTYPCIKCLPAPCVIAVLIHCHLFQRIDLNECLILSWNQEVSFSEVGHWLYKNTIKERTGCLFSFLIYFLKLFIVVLGMERRVLCMLGKHCHWATSQHPFPAF